MIKNIELLNYIKENISLVRTMVIKIEDLALLDNNKMLTSLGLNSGDDKTKWRYYLNLNGEYHITDEMMYVKSLDNDEQIKFTKENLKDHLATKKAYRLGGYYYTRLAEKYSHQVDLIKGIINPIPTSESIPAKNGFILRYNTDYVYDNEILLISKVQDVISKFIYQTFSTEYKYTENLMMSFLVGRLHNVVLKEILTYRLENSFTRQAHPFYIWSHLQSSGISPIYKKVLNKEQTFWLFRNIEYILRNQGKDFTFKLLIENLLTKRDIPLLKYDLVHSTETMKEDLLPKPLYQVRRLNLIDSKGYMDVLTTLPITMTKEVPDAIDNGSTYEMYLAKTEDDGRDSYTSNYPIKLLESSMIDTTLRKPETIFHVINAELIYLAKNDIYNINLDIVEPLSGNHFRFNVKEAITLWYGLLDKLNGCTSGKLSEIFYNKALRITPPTLEQLMDLSGPPFLTEGWCEDLLKTHISQSRIISPIAFFNNAKAISDLKWVHEKMYSMFPSIGYYSRRKNACSAMYESGWTKLTDFKTLDELLYKKGMNLEDYNDSDLENLIFELWNKMTGWSAAGYTTLGSMQQGLIDLMKYLSSYSVQYIQNISVADGWYEGGLDLLTENPVNLGTDGEKPELEAGGDNFRIPVDIHVVTQNEIDKSIIGIIEENGFILEGESDGRGDIKQTPFLYPVEIEDDEPTGGILSMNGCLDQRCVPFTGKLPFDIEDFIPKGSTLNNQHKTNSMLIDRLTGIRKVGDWEIFNLEIVSNGLDNLFVSNKFNFQHINNFVFLTGDNNTNTVDYYFSPSKCEVGKYVLKLEVSIKNIVTNETRKVRFDYPIEIKETTHSVTFDIPESVDIDEEFIITPKFTGLEISDEYEFIDVMDDPSNEYLYLEPSLNEYVTIRQENGVIYAKFIKSGWPKELPLYLQSKLKYKTSSVTNPYKDIYLHSIGNIPSDRYYDPIYDEDFIPTYQGYNQRREGINVSFGMIGDEFKVISEKKGWGPVKLEIKGDDNGNYPKRVLLDYEGFKDVTNPLYEKSDNVTIDGKEYCNFITYFSYDELDDKEDQEQTLTMVLTLQNKNGLIVKKEFDYKFFMVSVMNFNIDEETLPKELPIGIDSNSEIKYTTYTSNDEHEFNGIVSKDIYNDLTMNFSPTLKDGVLGDLTINPKTLWEKDHEFLISVKGRNENYHGLTFNYISMGIINLTKDSLIDIDSIKIEDFRIEKYTKAYDTDLVKHASISQALCTNTDVKGWYISKMSFPVENGLLVDKNLIGRITSEATGEYYDFLTQDDKMPYTIFRRTKDDFNITDENLMPDEWVDQIYWYQPIPANVGLLKTNINVTIKNKYSDKLEKTLVYQLVENVIEFEHEIEPMDEKLLSYIDRLWSFKEKRTDKLRSWADDKGWDVGTLSYAYYYTLNVSEYNSDKNRNVYSVTWTSWKFDLGVSGPKYGYLNVSEDGPGLNLIAYRQIGYNTTPFKGIRDGYAKFYTFYNIKNETIVNLTIEDFEIEIMGSDHYQGLTSTDMIAPIVIPDSIWRFLSITPAFKDKENESDYILTSIDGYPSVDNLYNSWLNEGTPKRNIRPWNLRYTPSKVGKMIMDLIIVATNPYSPNRKEFRYQYEVDVKENPLKETLYGIDNSGNKINENQIRFLPDISNKLIFDVANIPRIKDTDYDITDASVYAKSNNITLGIEEVILNADKPNLNLVINKTPTDDEEFLYIVEVKSKYLFEEMKDELKDYRIYKTLYVPHNLAKELFGEKDISYLDFNIKPDLVYEKSQPYEQQTDRYLLNKKFGDWKIKNTNFDISNKQNGLIFYGYDSDDIGGNIVAPTAYFKDYSEDPNISYLYLDLVPLKTGDIIYKVNINIVNETTKETKTISFNYNKKVLEQSSYMRLTHNEIPNNSDEVVKIYFDNVPNKIYPSLSLGGCIAESLKGFKDTDKLDCSLYGKTVTLNLTSNEDKEYVFYVRWNYFWNNDTLGRSKDSELRHITYYQQFTIPKGNVNSNVLKSLVDHFSLDNKDINVHYLNEGITYPNTGNRVLNLTARDDFPYTNQWYIQSTNLELPEGNDLFDKEYMEPYLINKNVNDKVQYNISFSPKETYSNQTVQIRLRLLDNYSNSRYIYIDYNFSAEDRRTLASSDINELITNDKIDINLTYVNIPPLEGTGFVTYPSFNPPSKWNDYIKGELDKDTNKGYVTGLKDFDEEIYLIYKNDYREVGKQPHLYFSRIYIKKSKAKE